MLTHSCTILFVESCGLFKLMKECYCVLMIDSGIHNSLPSASSRPEGSDGGGERQPEALQLDPSQQNKAVQCRRGLLYQERITCNTAF